MTLKTALVLALLALGLSPALAANPERFVARFADGSFLKSNLLVDWHSGDAAPKLDNQWLFDPANPLRWLVDRSQPRPGRFPEAYVELTTGDRLPGVVLDYRGGDESDYSPLPPHLLVQFEGPGFSSPDPATMLLRVDLKFVRRIVWNHSAYDPQPPRSAVLRSGAVLRFRSIRWSRGAVSLLTESGPRRVGLDELSQMDLAPGDYWSSYFDELAVVAPDSQRRLLQCETVDGLVVTSSLDRLQPRVLGDAKDANRWLLGMQPAWSLDVVWLWQGTVRTRRSFLPDEVPLSRVPPSRVEQRSPLASSGRSSFSPGRSGFTTNRNFQGGPLRSATREAGWGFGVQAFSELEFDCPPEVRAFRSEFAIDAQMRDGGCVRVRVLNRSTGETVLYESPTVVGSDSVRDTGSLAIRGTGDQPRRLVLQVDPALSNRPPKADPFDIRDQVNWLDPVLELDQAKVQRQIESRLSRQQMAWRGWSTAAEGGAQIEHIPFWADAPANQGTFQTAVAVTGNALRLTRSLQLAATDQWLVVDAVRTRPPGPPCKIAVRIGDAMPAEWDVPAYDKSRSDFRPLVLSLADSHLPPSGEISLEVRQLPTADRVPILWRGIAVVGQHPLVYRLWEESQAATISGSASGSAESDAQQKYSGSSSVRLARGKVWRLSLAKPIAIRERPELGEYRYLRFAVRKQGGGGLQLLLRHSAEVDRPASYEAGSQSVHTARAKRLTNEPLPHDWQLLTRDLYGDFGNLDLKGLDFTFPDGELGWLDHIYLARTQNDFERITPKPSRK